MADIIEQDGKGVTVRLRIPRADWEALCDVARGTTPALIALRQQCPWLMRELALRLASLQTPRAASVAPGALVARTDLERPVPAAADR